MVSAARSAKALAALAALYLACGPNAPKRVDESSLPPAVDAGNGFVSLDTGPPQCGTLEDGGPCGCLELDFLTDAPNLYFVLDRSGSMLEDGKWQTVRSVISDTLLRLGPRVRYGVAVFPKPGTNCGPGEEVMAVSDGDAPSGVPGPSIKRFTSATSMSANGGTPTSSTLAGLQSNLQTLEGRTYVILATDGGPNCNSGASCDETSCIPNIEKDPGCPATGSCCSVDLAGPAACLDGAATEGAIAAIRGLGIPTYVIGVPGSAPYAGLLDRLATAGGTPRATSPLYYRVDSADASAFEEAVRAIAAKVSARCDLPIEPPPADPSRVNVYFDDLVLPADPENGWVFDGATIKLVGAACDRVMAGDVLGLRVVAGCPTVKPR